MIPLAKAFAKTILAKAFAIATDEKESSRVFRD
jgi:hypothetical protein